MGKSPRHSRRWYTSRRSHRLCDANPERADSIDLGELCVLMNSYRNVDHSQGDSGSAGRTRSVKAKPVARLESLAAASLGSLRGGERCDSGTGSEDIRRGRRDPGTCFDKILPDSERGDQKFVLLGSPLPGRDHQGRVQKRLSARSSSVVDTPTAKKMITTRRSVITRRRFG
jgi:hypothetical protein